jgi:hypothetical protein
VLGSLVKALAAPARWLDPNSTLPPLVDAHITGAQWAHLAVTVGVWVALPLTAGALRLARREVS